MNKVILIEFNELTPSLMFRFIHEGVLPNFEKFHKESAVYITDTPARGEDLNPWVQWVSVHTGLSEKEHGVMRLNEAKTFSGQFIWDKLSAINISSWICGSMNTNRATGFIGHHLPDPWSESISPHPAGKFDTYIDYISSSVHGHSSNTTPSAKNFIIFMLKNGLSLNTVIRVVKQLVLETLDKGSKWKRASLMDWFQLDVFRKIFKKDMPGFATFFSNSTAHYQHHYWRDFEPEKFGSTKIATGAKPDAIRYGYQNLDKVLGEIVELSCNDTTLIFCTALSQKPYLMEDLDQVRFYYHIKDQKLFGHNFGLDIFYKYTPVMAEQFHLEFNTTSDAEIAFTIMSGFTMSSDEYFHQGSNLLFGMNLDGNKIHGQCRCSKLVDDNAQIGHDKLGVTLNFHDLFYQMDDVKSGIHDSKGMLWIRDGTRQHIDHKEPVELSFITQTLSKIYDL